MPQPNQDNYHGSNLEPRVAKLETGLEILTRDVTSLANVVREQSRNIESEIQKLAVAVTQAAAPKKTEWHTLIALAALILAIGSAVFIPLNQKIQSNKDDVISLTAVYRQHEMLSGHPVEMNEIKHIEERLNKLELTEDERNKADLMELREIRKKITEYHMTAIVPK